MDRAQTPNVTERTLSALEVAESQPAPAHRTHVAPHVSWQFWRTFGRPHLPRDCLRKHLREENVSVHVTTVTPGPNGGGEGEGGDIGGLGGEAGGNGGGNGLGGFGGRTGGKGGGGVVGGLGGDAGGGRPFWHTLKSFEGQ